MNRINFNDRRYDDIIHLPHHVSTTHPPMPVSTRAAQFLPFAALSGFEGAIEETGRYTEQKAELDEDARGALDEKLLEIQAHLDAHPGEALSVSVTFFVPDESKAGGEYITVTENLKKIDGYGHALLMQGGRRIPMADILDIL